ncbi:MAG: triple tyrosine motif-containing protein, partial [Pseudomonadales bacterium]
LTSSIRYNSNVKESVDISYFDYFIRIFFHIPDFINSQGVKYRYKLHPFDPTWIDGGNDGSATYTNIPPGDYVFHVQGANSAGVWNREGISMNLRVLPPAWQTWWAYCLYAIVVYSLLLMGKKWYDSNVLRVKVTEMAREKTREADAALDDMQEQLEAQDSLVRNVRKRNIATLETVREIIDHRAEYLPDDVSADIMRDSNGHVHALALLEQSLKYYNDRLFADLNAFTADCLAELCREESSFHAVTTINEVTDQLVPADNATLLAIIIHELLHNAFRHAFNNDPKSRYLRIIMGIRSDAPRGSLHCELKVQDNGSGIPSGVTGDLPGLSLVQKIVRHFNGTMDTTSRDGSTITIALLLPDSARV